VPNLLKRYPHTLTAPFQLSQLKNEKKFQPAGVGVRASSELSTLALS
jgi:hypothetical protein